MEPTYILKHSQIIYYIYYLLFGLRGYRHCGHSWPIVPASGDNEDDCGEADGMWIGTGNRRHFCPSQNPT
jgi:hypothetical protein